MSRGCTTMPLRHGRAKRMVLLGLVLLALLDTVTGIPYKRSLLRLCSKSLSDALYLTCKGRGYNEPFSYSGEDDPQDTDGPGLAEECCYRQCSYTQLEQYCKPSNSSPVDAVRKKPVWIVNSANPSVRPETSSEERSRSAIDYVAGTIKCRIHGLKGARKKGTNLNRDDVVGCDGKGSMKRHRSGHCVCRHRRPKRRRLGKILERTLADRSSRSEAVSAPASTNKGSPFP